MTTCPKCGTRYSANQRLCPHDGTVLEPDQPSEMKQVGKVLDGKYRLDSYLSRGGMGAVYRATHVMLGRAVAVKLIKPDLVTSPDIVRRFQREARAVTHLKHPNIVEVYDLGQTDDGTLYIAMELVSGESLSAVIKSTGALSPDRIVRILGQVGSALALAHRNQIVHRDLKPHNIMVTRGEDGQDVAKLLDFGIAKTFEIDANTQLTATGSTLGTPQYMSPEQATGVDVDARSDLYSLGIILYEMLIGEVPFNDPSTPAVLVKHMNEAPMPPSRRRPDLQVSPALEAIALRLLEKEPAKRFQSAAEFSAALHSLPIAQLDAGGATLPLKSQAPSGQTMKPTVLDPPPSAASQAPTGSAAAVTAAPTAHSAPTRETTAAPPVYAAPPPIPPQTVPGTRPTVAAAAPPVPAPQPVPVRSRSVLVPIAALVVLVALLGAGYWAMTRSSEPAPDPSASSAAPPATPATAEPGKPEAPPPAAVVAPSATVATPPAASPVTRPAASQASAAAAPPASAPATTLATPPAAPPATAQAAQPATPPAAAPTSLTPTPAPVVAPSAEQPAPPAPGAKPETPASRRQRLSSALGAAGRLVTGRAKEAPPATPTVSFECSGPSEVCAPLRTAIQEAAEREGLVIVRGSRGAEILLTAEIEIVDTRQQVQFGTTIVTTTYSMDIAGEAPRFDAEVPMPASRTFSADPRIGAERFAENGRLAAAGAIERVLQFWQKKVP